MSLACQPNKPTPTSEELLLQKLNRDIGLSNIYNVNSQVIPCIESFENPSYYMSGATKPITGLTLTSEGVYNLSEVNDFDLTFNFTGSTDYTGYTGQFCYQLLPYLSSATVSGRCESYSGITGSSVSGNFTTTEVSPLDNEYRIRSWNVFDSKCATGLTIDTSIYVDETKDFYIATVVNPPKPTLELVPSDLFNDISFFNETIYSPVEGSNQFLLTEQPVGNAVVISVNGVTVSNEDYTIDTNDARLITIVSGITLESTDVLQAYYNKTSLDGAAAVNLENFVKLEIFSVTGVTSGVTSSFSATTYENFVNYNTDNNRLEIFLNEKIDPSTHPTVTINGVDMVFNIDVFKSNVVDNKLVLAEGLTVETGDIISVYYYYSGLNNPGDLGILLTDTPTFEWSTQENVLRTDSSSGTFTVEISDRADPSFTTILNTGTTLYNNFIAAYTLNVGPITTTSIEDYIYRIKFSKTYTTNDVVNSYVTETYSNTGSFRLNWDYINNTNF